MTDTPRKALMLASSLVSFAVCAFLILSQAPDPVRALPGTPEALLSVLSPPGTLRVAERDTPTGRQIVILQDARVPALDPGLAARILAASTGFDPGAGDQLTIERVAFASPPPLERLPAQSLLAALALFAGGLASLIAVLLPGHRAGAQTIPALAPSLPLTHEPRPRRSAGSMDLAADLAASDPDAATRVIRHWLREDQGHPS